LILINPDLQELDLVALTDLQARPLELRVHRWTGDYLAVLSQTGDVIEQDRDVAAFADKVG
jgi:hypothetical protein